MKKPNQGFVDIPRITLQFPIWKDPHEQGLLFYCMFTASHKPYRGLRPGQFYTSKEKIAKALGWSKSTVYKSLASLQEKHLLQSISSKQGTIITVCHWAELTSCQAVPQDVLDELGVKDADEPADPIVAILQEHGIDPAVDDEDDSTAQSTHARPAKAAIPCEETPRHTPDAENTNEQRLMYGFNLFWDAYPRKIHKDAAWDMYRALDADPPTLMDALKAAKLSPQWQEEGGRYIPSPAKWLDGTWERYIPAWRREDGRIWTSR